MQKHPFIALVAALIALAAAQPVFAQAVAAPPPSLAEAKQSLAKAQADCERDVQGAWPAAPHVSDGLTALVVRFSQAPQAACAMVDLARMPAKERLAALQAEVDRARGAFGCAARPETPECDAVAGAAHRLASVKQLYQEDAASLSPTDPRYHMRSSFQHNATAYAAGEDPVHGMSFLRLVSIAANPGGPPPFTADATTRFAQSMITSTAQIDCHDECRRSVERTISMVPLYRSLRSAFQLATSPVFEEPIERLTELQAKWDAYHFGGGTGRAQLPWELLLNSYLYNREQAGKDQVAWKEPPSDAWVLVHPSTGLALKDTKGAKSDLLHVVEVIGHSWWDYDSETQARKNERGLSLVAGYQSREDGDDWGYGVLLRVPYQALNIVWVRTELDNGESDDTIGLTLDLTKILPKFGSAACLFKLGSCKAN